jgi:hypothetical protein
VEAAQAAVDAWVACYNTDRPHQGLDVKVPVVPADRFVAAEPAEGVKLWLPETLEVLDTPGTAQAVTELVTGPVTVPAVVVSAVGERVRGSHLHLRKPTNARYESFAGFSIISGFGFDPLTVHKNRGVTRANGQGHHHS